ncbi:MAG: phage tail protein [Blastocatellales bacterium]
MSEPYVGEIRMFAGNFAPRGWAFCDGQLLAVSQNDALFSLLGTTFGGDGRTTFGLPDLRGRIPVHPDSTHRWGQKAGAEKVTLTVNQLPAHTHPLTGSSGSATAQTPSGWVYARGASDLYTSQNTPVKMSSQAIGSVGGSQSHDNLQPFLCIHYIIALFGIYPSRH